MKPECSMYQLAQSEVLDEHGASRKLSSFWQGRTAVLIFLRHFACVACRAHASQVWAEREKYQSRGAEIVFVGNGAANFITGFKEDLGLEGATVMTDPSLVAFRAAGFKRGFLASFGPRSLLNAYSLLGQGYRPGNLARPDKGDLWQLGGVLVVHASGKLAYHYISQAQGDFAPSTDTQAAA